MKVARVIINVLAFLIFILGVGFINSLIFAEPDSGMKYIDATTANGLDIILFCVDYDKIDEAIAITSSKVVRNMGDIESLIVFLQPYGVEQINFSKRLIEIILEDNSKVLQ